MSISKEDYKRIVTNKSWDRVRDIFPHTSTITPTIHSKLSINPSDWVQFSIDNLPLAKQEWNNTKAHYTGATNDLAVLNNELGREEGNTSNINYGTEGSTNDMLLELLGLDNLHKLNLAIDTVLIRLLIKMPGHGFPWHFDDAASYISKFSHLNIDSNKQCKLGKAVRYWFPVVDWEDGHVLQISKTMLHHWQAGDTYTIPWGQPHGSSNFGYKPMYTVSLTGIVVD